MSTGQHVKDAPRRCFVCGCGPRGLRAYETTNRTPDGTWITLSWVCAEWLVPCHRRNSPFGLKARRGLPVGERGRVHPIQAAHRARVAARARRAG